MTLYYSGIHRDQFDGGPKQNQNCVPTAVANGTRVVTHGLKDYSGSYVRALIPRWQETNPFTAGWSLEDAQHAAAKMGIGTAIYNHSQGASWNQIQDWLERGYACLLQGKSIVFTEGCSAKFNGGHAILAHPNFRNPDLWQIGDGICSSWRYERAVKLRQYIEALYGANHIRYLRFTTPVPILTPDTDTDAEENIDVQDTVVKGEDWRAIGGNGVFRSAPNRGLTPWTKVPDGTIIRSIMECRTAKKDGSFESWRLTEWQAKPAYMIVTTPRTDWEPLVQGGDPAVDAGLSNYIARK